MQNATMEEQGVKLISAHQLVLLMVLCRVFSVMVYAPRGASPIDGTVVLLAQFLAVPVQLLLLYPIYKIFKLTGSPNIIRCAYGLGRPVGVVVAGLFWLFTTFVLVYAVTNFEFFITSTIYPQDSGTVVIVLLLLAAAYCAYLGIEPISRLSMVVMVCYSILLIFIVLAVLPRISLLNLLSPLDVATPQTLGRAVLSIVLLNGELIAIMLLAPITKGNVKKAYIKINLIWLLVLGCITFVTLTGLGDYSRTQQFPVYSLSLVAEVSVMERLDALHMSVWVFLALLKSALYLYLSCNCLTQLLPQKISRFGLGINLAVALGFSLLIGSDIRGIQIVATIVISYAPVLIMLAIPLLLWLGLLGKKKKEARRSA